MTPQEILNHHNLTYESYKSKLNWWNEEIKCGNRCMNCWLRLYECFCSEIIENGNVLKVIKEHVNVKMCIYYHYQEIGRSANTAHVFEALYNSDLERNHLNNPSCEVLIFGDRKSEQLLIHEINQEIENNCPSTCILYPATNSITLLDWLDNRPQSIRTKPIRIVTLDGTFAQASRQAKFLSKSLKLLYGKDLPVVKLNLGDKPVRSALFGIQSQPGEDKLCSYQAMVMALEQVGQNPEICNFLTNFLDLWLKYILLNRIKLGKQKQHAKLDIQPAPYVEECRAQNAIILAQKARDKKQKRSFILKYTSRLQVLKLSKTSKFSVFILVMQ